MPGPTRTRTARPAALALLLVLTAALLLAACTDGSNPSAAGSPTSGAPATSSPGTTGTSGTTSPTPSGSAKPSKPSKPSNTSKPPKHRAPFAFRVAHTGHTLTTRKLGAAKLHHAMQETVPAIKRRFDQLFRMTFVDPAHWKTAKYGEAFQTIFGGQVRQKAAASLEKLTLGSDAGKRFVSVGQPAGQLNVNVLIGAGGGPVTALVRATFNEKARRTDGGTTVIVVDGRYYLSPSKRGWLIDGFRVGRHDHEL